MILGTYTSEISKKRLFVQWTLSSALTSMYTMTVTLHYAKEDTVTVKEEDNFFCVIPDFKIKKLTKESFLELTLKDYYSKDNYTTRFYFHRHQKLFWNLRRVEIHKFQQHSKFINSSKIVIFKRREWGTRCNHCGGGVEISKGRDTCERCLGTGFMAGYFRPIGLYGKIIGETLKRGEAMVGTGVGGQRVFQTYGLPKLSINDLIYNKTDDQFYTVVSTQAKETGEVPSLQQIATNALPKKAGTEFRPYLEDERNLEG